MKTTTIILAAALLLTSCQKRQCWQCITETITTPNGVVKQAQVSEPYFVCDKTKAEIRSYERQNSRTDTSGIVTITQTVTCQ